MCVCVCVWSACDDRCRPMLVLVQCAGDGSVVEELEVTQLLHLADYSQPHAPGTQGVRMCVVRIYMYKCIMLLVHVCIIFL